MPKTLGELLSEVLDESAPSVSFGPEHLDARAEDLARRFRRARDDIDASGGVDAPTGDEALSADDLRSFVEGTLVLAHAQQRLLFTNPALRDQYQALTRGRPGLAAANPTAAAVVEMPSQRAAASGPSRDFRRPLRGGEPLSEVGELALLPVDEDGEIYLQIKLNDPDTVARVLHVEREHDGRAASQQLPPPQDGIITLVLDPKVESEGDLLELLLDRTATGFLRPQ